MNKKEKIIKPFNIQIGKIKEHKDGSATYEFHYDKKFEKFVCKQLKLKEITGEQISNYILKMLEDYIKKEEEHEE